VSRVTVIAGPVHACERDGHLIALRLQRDFDAVSVTPICESCHLIFLPSSKMTGKQADWLMGLVEKARFTPEAPPEAYERLFDGDL